jgi:hypothetical protein
MSRPQKPSTPQLVVRLDAEALAAASDAHDQLSVADQAVLASAELYKLVGRIETAHFYETVSSRIMAESYVRARVVIGELGSVACADASGRAKHVSSLEEFCQVQLGISQRRCQQLVSNMAVLGPELYDRAEQVGFKARDYQALKALPMDAQAAVKLALESGEKEAAIDLVYDFAERLAAAQKHSQELADENEAKDRVIKEDTERLNKLRAAKKFKASETSIARDAEQQAQLDELHQATSEADVVFMRLANVVSLICSGDSKPMRGRSQQAVQYLVSRLADVIDQHGIEIILAEQISAPPEWLSSLPAPKTETF